MTIHDMQWAPKSGLSHLHQVMMYLQLARLPERTLIVVESPIIFFDVFLAWFKQTHRLRRRREQTYVVYRKHSRWYGTRGNYSQEKKTSCDSHEAFTYCNNIINEYNISYIIYINIYIYIFIYITYSYIQIHTYFSTWIQLGQAPSFGLHSLHSSVLGDL